MSTNSNQLYLTNKKLPWDIDIPPRKLMYQNESPRVLLPEETLLRKFLPYNSSDDEDDPYAADHFRIYEFKVRKCTRSRSHDWTDCPFAHPGEKARRRCPRRYNYLGTVCADFRRGSCSRGDLCEFAHGVFECWLHPSRYRTEACKDGKNCQRKICFFAHTQRQLRVVPPEPTVLTPGKKYHSPDTSHCTHCRCHLDTHHTNSPTSTLHLDLDSLSPPASPARSGTGFSPISRFADRLARAESLGMTPLGSTTGTFQQDSMNELMRSMEAMTVEETEFQNMKSLWINACLNRDLSVSSDQSPCLFSRSASDSRQVVNKVYNNNNNNNNNEGCGSGPDFGWVNDLLT